MTEEEEISKKLTPLDATILSILNKRRLTVEEVREEVNSVRMSLRYPPINDKNVLEVLKKLHSLGLVRALEIRDKTYWELTEKGTKLA